MTYAAFIRTNYMFLFHTILFYLPYVDYVTFINYVNTCLSPTYMRSFYILHNNSIVVPWPRNVTCVDTKTKSERCIKIEVDQQSKRKKVSSLNIS